MSCTLRTNHAKSAKETFFEKINIKKCTIIFGTEYIYVRLTFLIRPNCYVCTCHSSRFFVQFLNFSHFCLYFFQALYDLKCIDVPLNPYAYYIHQSIYLSVYLSIYQITYLSTYGMGLSAYISVTD